MTTGAAADERARPTIQSLFGSPLSTTTGGNAGLDQAAPRTAAPETRPVADRDPGGPGAALSPAVRARMENSFGVDFSAVRVHEGEQAPAMGALAYTRGTHVHFAPGRYEPDTARGQELLGHELAHVVQQSEGRVTATAQPKGLALHDDAGLEREADEWGARAARGEPVGRGAGGAVIDHGGGGAVQRKIGVELEVKRPVTTADGDDLDSDTNLLLHGGFKLVSDSRTNADREHYSNLELVMDPAFDQMTGPLDQAKAGFRARLGEMEELYDQLYKNDDKRDLGALPGVADKTYAPCLIDETNAEGGNWSTAKLRPDFLRDGEDDKKLYVHYTIGFPIATMRDAIAEIGRRTREDGHPDCTPDKVVEVAKRHDRPRTHALAAVELADSLASTLGAGLDTTERAAFTGMVALVYTQVAAFADEVQGELTDAEDEHLPRNQQKPFGAGQIKNKTAVLSRIRLDAIYKTLPRRVRTLLQLKSKTIIKAFIAELGKTGSAWNPNWQRGLKRGSQDGRRSTKLGPYANSGLRSTAGNGVDQQIVFGGMHTVPELDDSVPGGGIPVELRMVGERYVSWDDLYIDAEKWLVWSREKIEEAYPPAAAQPGAPDEAHAEPAGRPEDEESERPGPAEAHAPGPLPPLDAELAAGSPGPSTSTSSGGESTPWISFFPRDAVAQTLEDPFGDGGTSEDQLEDTGEDPLGDGMPRPYDGDAMMFNVAPSGARFGEKEEPRGKRGYESAFPPTPQPAEALSEQLPAKRVETSAVLTIPAAYVQGFFVDAASQLWCVASDGLSYQVVCQEADGTVYVNAP